MSTDDQSSVLFTAALLSSRKGIGYRDRSRIISCVPSFDVTSRKDVIDGLHQAFQESGIPFFPRHHPSSNRIRTAAATAQQWLNSGVFVVRSADVNAPAPLMHDLPPVVFGKGNRSVLDLRAGAVLNSRKPRVTGPQDRWLVETKCAVGSALERGFAIASSYGTLPYSIVSRLAKGSAVLVACDTVLPFMASDAALQRFLDDYRDLFDREQTLFLSTFSPGVLPRARNRYVERDQLVAALSSLVFPVDVRPGGNMESLVKTAEERGCRVESPRESVSDLKRPKVRCERKARGRERSAPRSSHSQQAASRSTMSLMRPAHAGADTWVDVKELVEQSSHLIHYTRSCPGPWPGQTMADYCEELIEEYPAAGHTAFDSLTRILEQGVIRGSHKLTRGASSVVCFTECLPHELVDVLEWRAGLIRWSFEPYGIALSRASLFALGARPVIYAVEEAFEDLGNDLRFLFQPQRAVGKNWALEKEWRIQGDLHLTGAVQQDMFAIVTTPAEASILAGRFGCRVALTSAWTRKRVRRASQ